MPDDDFEPRLGRMRAKGSKHGSRYLAQLVAATVRSGARKLPGQRFDGSRIGRGAPVGRLLALRDRHAGFRTRRAIVKTRLVRLGTKGGAGAAHLRYIQRDGVTREGMPGELYGPGEESVADGRAFLERGEGDRHQFRFIVSVEDAAEYEDLKPFVRRLMTQMEADLGTRLDWVAVDHFNTGHAHSHIVLRGVDDRGRNLVIAREYIAHGMRARASERATLDLGPRTDREIEARLRLDIGEERLTATDRQLLRDMDASRSVAAAGRDPFAQTLRAGRLRKLAQLGLADELRGGNWRLAEHMESTLRAMGERGDIVRTLQRELSACKLPWADCIIEQPLGGDMKPLVGRVVRRGLSDELQDRHYLIVDGLDGHTHYVDIGSGEATPPTPEGAIVRVTARPTGARHVDKTVAEIAEANEGRYSIDLHLRHDPRASEEFAQAHVRRLEAMRRVAGTVERDPDGSWRITPDHIERAAVFEARVARDRPVTVAIESAIPLERLARYDGATWLDRRLVATDAELARDARFGGEVRTAEVQRRRWLIEQELASEQDDGMHFSGGLIAILRRRELLRVAGQLSTELGLAFAETGNGERVEGRLVRPVDLASGKFALIEKSKEFTLVPWRPVLEPQVGKQVSGLVRGEAVTWTIGRGRGGPSIG